MMIDWKINIFCVVFIIYMFLWFFPSFVYVGINSTRLYNKIICYLEYNTNIWDRYDDKFKILKLYHNVIFDHHLQKIIYIQMATAAFAFVSNALLGIFISYIDNLEFVRTLQLVIILVILNLSVIFIYYFLFGIFHESEYVDMQETIIAYNTFRFDSMKKRDQDQGS